MEHSLLVGIGASSFTASSLIPQLVKLIKEKKPGKLSMGTLVILFIGLGLWIYYGFLKTDWVIIISNTVALVLNMIITFLTIRYANGGY